MAWCVLRDTYIRLSFLPVLDVTNVDNTYGCNQGCNTVLQFPFVRWLWLWRRRRAYSFYCLRSQCKITIEWCFLFCESRIALCLILAVRINQ